MTKLNWEKSNQLARVRDKGGESAGADCYSGNFSLIHLQPTMEDRNRFLAYTRQLLAEKTIGLEQEKAWLARFAQFDQFVPPWIEDDEIKKLVAAVKSRAAAYHISFDANVTESRQTKLRAQIARLEHAVIKGRFSSISFEQVMKCVHLFDALQAALPKDEKLRLRIKLRTSIHAIGVDKLAHWEVRGFPMAFDVKGWLDLFESFAPGLRDHPVFKRAAAINTKGIWL